MDGDGIEAQVIEVGFDVAVVRPADVAALGVQDQRRSRSHSMNVLNRLGQDVHAGAAMPLIESGVWLVDSSDIMGCLNDAAVEIVELIRRQVREGPNCFGVLRVRGVGVEPHTDVTSRTPHRMYHPHECAVWHRLFFLSYVAIAAKKPLSYLNLMLDYIKLNSDVDKISITKGIARRFAPHRASTLWRSLRSLSPQAGKQVFSRPLSCAIPFKTPIIKNYYQKIAIFYWS